MPTEVTSDAESVKSAIDLVDTWADQAAPVIEGLDPNIKATVETAKTALDELRKVVDTIASALGAS